LTGSNNRPRCVPRAFRSFPRFTIQSTGLRSGRHDAAPIGRYGANPFVLIGGLSQQPRTTEVAARLAKIECLDSDTVEPSRPSALRQSSRMGSVGLKSGGDTRRRLQAVAVGLSERSSGTLCFHAPQAERSGRRASAPTHRIPALPRNPSPDFQHASLRAAHTLRADVEISEAPAFAIDLLTEINLSIAISSRDTHHRSEDLPVLTSCSLETQSRQGTVPRIVLINH
jgi:hypothetical protein